MIRADFVNRKCRLIAEDLSHLLNFKDDSLEDIAGDFVKLAAVERLLERIIMRAIDVNLHLIGELSSGMDEKTTRLTYRGSFLRLADYGVCPESFALEDLKKRRASEISFCTITMTSTERSSMPPFKPA